MPRPVSPESAEVFDRRLVGRTSLLATVLERGADPEAYEDNILAFAKFAGDEVDIQDRAAFERYADRAESHLADLGIARSRDDENTFEVQIGQGHSAVTIIADRLLWAKAHVGATTRAAILAQIRDERRRAGEGAPAKVGLSQEAHQRLHTMAGVMGLSMRELLEELVGQAWELHVARETVARA